MSDDTLTVLIGGVRVQLNAREAGRLCDATAIYLARQQAADVPELLRTAFPTDDLGDDAISRDVDQATLIGLFRLMAGVIAMRIERDGMSLTDVRRLAGIARLFSEVCDAMGERWQSEGEIGMVDAH